MGVNRSSWTQKIPACANADRASYSGLMGKHVRVSHFALCQFHSETERKESTGKKIPFNVVYSLCAGLDLSASEEKCHCISTVDFDIKTIKCQTSFNNYQYSINTQILNTQILQKLITALTEPTGANRTIWTQTTPVCVSAGKVSPSGRMGRHARVSVSGCNSLPAFLTTVTHIPFTTQHCHTV